MNATGSEYGAALSKFEGGEDGNDAASPAKDFEEDISLSLSLSLFVFLPFKNAWYCNNSELRASCEVLLSSISEETRRAERQRRGDASGSERETNKLSRAHHRRVLFSLLSLLLLLLQS